MPRYYFHIFANDDCRLADDEGCDLPDDAAALREAISSAHDMASEAARSGRVGDKRIEVTNEAGDLLRTVAVTALVS